MLDGFPMNYFVVNMFVGWYYELSCAFVNDKMTNTLKFVNGFAFLLLNSILNMNPVDIVHVESYLWSFCHFIIFVDREKKPERGRERQSEREGGLKWKGVVESAHELLIYTLNIAVLQMSINLLILKLNLLHFVGFVVDDVCVCVFSFLSFFLFVVDIRYII